MPQTRKFSWRELIFIAGFFISLAITLVFAARAIHALRRPSLDESIRPWMSLNYIASSYNLPGYYLYEALGIPYVSHDRRPLSRIARDLNQPVNNIIAALQKAIVQGRPPNPTPLPYPTESSPTPSISNTRSAP